MHKLIKLKKYDNHINLIVWDMHWEQVTLIGDFDQAEEHILKTN